MKNDCLKKAFTKSPNHSIAKSPDHSITKSRNHHITKSPDHNTLSSLPGKIGLINHVAEEPLTKTEIIADSKETPCDIRINTSLHQRNGLLHSWKCELTFVEIPSDIKETGIDIVAVPADIRGNANVHRVNTHQHSWKPQLTAKHCQLTLKKCMTTLLPPPTAIKKSALNAKNYDSNIVSLVYSLCSLRTHCVLCDLPTPVYQKTVSLQ